ncbi:MAG: ImmA/IrrE family metallo-endopeptidase [Bacilli bacterium]
MCESLSGCTFYNCNQDIYIILYNDDTSDNNVEGRIRWTLAHELGHCMLQHLNTMSKYKAAENSFGNIDEINLQIETEADVFAANFLSPLPLFEKLHIQSPVDIKNTFGLSALASNNRMQDYLKWKNTHFKCSYDNEMKKCFN